MVLKNLIKLKKYLLFFKIIIFLNFLNKLKKIIIFSLLKKKSINFETQKINFKEKYKNHKFINSKNQKFQNL
jgi:hypothetical protein